MKKSAITYLAACGRGASQVMLQRSVAAGALFMAGILAGGWIAAALALAALMLATAACGPRRQGYADGLWGFNALLVGCAAAALPCPGAIALAIAAYLTIPLKQILDKCFAPIGISSLTLPFILSTWALVGAAHWLGATDLFGQAATADIVWQSMPDALAGLLKGLSQVFLANSWVAGLLMLAALLATDWRAAAWAIAGSAIGMACAALCHCPWADIADGLWGFSPALTAIAVGVTFRPQTATWRWTIATIAAILITFGIQLAAGPLLSTISLPALTLPFCIATWLTALLQKGLCHKAYS